MTAFRSLTDEQIVTRSGWEAVRAPGLWWEKSDFARPPVSRVLVAVREAIAVGDFDAYGALISINEPDAAEYYTYAEIEHARRVLTKLAAVSA